MSISREAMLQKIKENVHDIDPTAEVWLYGSRARGTAREDSDWDVLVLTKEDSVSVQRESCFVDHICDLIVESGQAIQLFVYGGKDWHNNHSVTPFYQNVQKDAIRL